MLYIYIYPVFNNEWLSLSWQGLVCSMFSISVKSVVIREMTYSWEWPYKRGTAVRIFFRVIHFWGVLFQHTYDSNHLFCNMLIFKWLLWQRNSTPCRFVIKSIMSDLLLCVDKTHNIGNVLNSNQDYNIQM